VLLIDGTFDNNVMCVEFLLRFDLVLCSCYELCNSTVYYKLTKINRFSCHISRVFSFCREYAELFYASHSVH